jgi:hypothetical protein
VSADAPEIKRLNSKKKERKLTIILFNYSPPLINNIFTKKSYFIRIIVYNGRL